MSESPQIGSGHFRARNWRRTWCFFFASLIAIAGVADGATASNKSRPLANNLQAPNESPSGSGTASEATTAPQGGKPVQPFAVTLPQNHLLGDWGGVLPKLADFGVTPALTYVSDSSGNPIGGRSRGVAYADNIGFQLGIDLEKMAGLSGASFLVSMSYRDGHSLSRERVGNVFTIEQLYGGQTFHLIDVAYQQKLFDDHVELSLGRLAAGDDFLVSEYDYIFMQNGFDGNPVGIFFNSPGMTAYPNSTWGGRVTFKPTRRSYIMAGVYNGDPTIRDVYHRGVDLSMDGPLFAIMEMGYRVNGLPGDSQYLGNYKIGAWYDQSPYTDYTTVARATPARTRNDNWGICVLVDQVVAPFGEPGSNRGLSVFGSLLVSPDESRSQMPYFFTAGVAARGIVDSRPEDVLALGALFGEFSSDLRQSQEREQLLDPTVGVQTHEAVIELTYRISYNHGAVFLQPDIQYIVNPGAAGKYQDALVLGCQLGVNF